MFHSVPIILCAIYSSGIQWLCLQVLLTTWQLLAPHHDRRSSLRPWSRILWHRSVCWRGGDRMKRRALLSRSTWCTNGTRPRPYSLIQDGHTDERMCSLACHLTVLQHDRSLSLRSWRHSESYWVLGCHGTEVRLKSSNFINITVLYTSQTDWCVNSL